MTMSQRHSTYVTGFRKEVKRPEPSQAQFALALFGGLIGGFLLFLLIGEARGWL